jgi:hypothetical protein
MQASEPIPIYQSTRRRIAEDRRPNESEFRTEILRARNKSCDICNAFSHKKSDDHWFENVISSKWFQFYETTECSGEPCNARVFVAAMKCCDMSPLLTTRSSFKLFSAEVGEQR